MGWLDKHMNEFVKPVLGFVPTEPLHYFSDSELTVVKNIWRSAKQAADKKPILLAGRDVFLFEILARRENYPTLFLSQVSRISVREVAAKMDLRNYFLFDTGFMGSIPRVLAITNFKMISHHLRGSDKQIFPRLSNSRALALKIEYTPKYWKSGRVKEGDNNEKEVVQEYTEKEEFERAARLTLEVYKNSATRFIEASKPIQIDSNVGHAYELEWDM